MVRKPVLFRVTNNLNIGGIQRRLRSLLPLLRDEFEVHIVTYKDKGIFYHELEQLGVHCHFIPLKGKWDPVGIWKLKKLFEKYKADIVHTHSLGGNISGILAAAWARVPVKIANVHLSRLHWYAKGRLHRLKQIYQEKIIHNLFTDKILFVSQESLLYYRTYTGINSDKLQILYNGIDLPQFSQSDIQNIKQEINPENKKNIGFVGRLVRGKGLDTFINFALNVLKQNSKKYLFIIIGEGHIRNYWENIVKQAGQERNILFLGEKKNIHDYYQVMDCLAFFSEPGVEGMSGVALEAAMHGLPIMATKTRPMQEIAKFYPHIIFDKHIPELKDKYQQSHELTVQNMAKNTVRLYNYLIKNENACIHHQHRLSK